MVIDSSALLAMYLKEPGHEAVFEKITASPAAVVAAPVLLETAMVLSARTRQDARPMLMSSLRQLGVQVVAFGEDHFDAALDAFLRYGKGRHPAALNFGDCMAYATAVVSGVPLLYVGGDFAKTDVEAA